MEQNLWTRLAKRLFHDRPDWQRPGREPRPIPAVRGERGSRSAARSSRSAR